MTLAMLALMALVVALGWRKAEARGRENRGGRWG
jgi:hypothetical protein